jgi:anaerobic selenocysteine-containing dehydrogenase
VRIITLIYECIVSISRMSPSMTYQKVLQGKRVTIESSIAKKYSINEGDIVIVEDDNGTIKITPAQVIKRPS